jgi:hypothetical protein
MIETVQQFNDRIYINHKKDKVFVWKTAKNKHELNDKFETWSIQTAKNYLHWLENNQ